MGPACYLLPRARQSCPCPAPSWYAKVHFFTPSAPMMCVLASLPLVCPDHHQHQLLPTFPLAPLCTGSGCCPSCLPPSPPCLLLSKTHKELWVLDEVPISIHIVRVRVVEFATVTAQEQVCAVKGTSCLHLLQVQNE
jgi:hypothetical protein